MGQTFLEAMYESFNQEYQTFHLLTGFSEPVAARSAPRKNVTASDPTKSLAEAAAAQERWSELVTDEFNLHQQYDAVDITVTAIAGSDLAATLPTSWVPMSKNSPAFEAAMRQRGFKVSVRRMYLPCTYTVQAQLLGGNGQPSRTGLVSWPFSCCGGRGKTMRHCVGRRSLV